MASTDPSPLEEAFIAQAHSTALSLPVAPMGTSRTGPADNARKPVGNGIPITKPRGARSRALTTSRYSNLSPTQAVKTWGRKNTSAARATIHSSSGIQAISVRESHRRETKLPAALDNIDRKIITVQEKLECTRKRKKPRVRVISNNM